MSKDYMADVSKNGTSIKLTVVPHNGENLVAVDAATEDGRRAVVVWSREGTGWPVVDDMEDSESDVVWQAVEAHMLANNLWQ